MNIYFNFYIVFLSRFRVIDNYVCIYDKKVKEKSLMSWLNG